MWKTPVPLSAFLKPHRPLVLPNVCIELNCHQLHRQMSILQWVVSFLQCSLTHGRSWVLSLIKYCYFVKVHYWFFDFFLILWESHMKTLLYCAVPFENWLQVSAFRSAKECSTASTYIVVSFMLCWLSNKKGGLQGTVWPNSASVLFLFCHPSAFLQELKETQSFFLFFFFFFLVYQIVLKQCWHWLNLLQIQSLTDQLNGSPEVL